MEVVKDKCRFWGVLLHGEDEGHRVVCGYSLYPGLCLTHFLPELVKGISSLTIFDVYDLTCQKIYYNSLVDMSLADSKLVYADILKFAQVGISVMTLEIALLYVLYSIL